MEPNCSLPAPFFYTTLMHSFHLVSYPIYFLTLLILIRDSSKIFKTYKYYIIFHVIMNMASETYVSFFMLPLTYLPLPMYRTTGWLAHLGFSGLIQFYILSILIDTTVGSICEMFYFRFKVSMIHQEAKIYSKILKYLLNIRRFSNVAVIFVEVLTFSDRIADQTRTIASLRERFPEMPPEIACYSCVYAVGKNVPFRIMVSFWTTNTIVSFGSSTIVIFYVKKFLKKTGIALSAETTKLQRMLLMSLFIQSAIHSTLIGIPLFFQIFGMFVKMTDNDFVLILLLFVGYHGFASTCAMIYFTKPVREKMFPCLKRASQTTPARLSYLNSTTT